MHLSIRTTSKMNPLASTTLTWTFLGRYTTGLMGKTSDRSSGWVAWPAQEVDNCAHHRPANTLSGSVSGRVSSSQGAVAMSAILASLLQVWPCSFTNNALPLHFHICEAIKDRSDIASNPLRDQWRRLVLDPLLELDRSPCPSSYILVDALDECDII